MVSFSEQFAKSMWALVFGKSKNILLAMLYCDTSQIAHETGPLKHKDWHF